MTPAPPIGVLLVNLGTPDAPTRPAVRRYLKEFLSDPLVVDANRLVWWFVLNGIILPFRSGSSARLYRRVWTDAGSPLLVAGRELARAMQAELGDGFDVELGMRYGNPSMASAVGRLLERGSRRIVLAPLFPQYSRTTTGSIEARMDELVADAPADLEVVRLAPYYADPGYLESVASLVRERREAGAGDHVVFSFHGIPVRYAEAGDPYPEHCHATATELARVLDLNDDDWSLVFQSRFGREPWLQPYADERVPALAARYPRAVVACPGFAADCLETVDEIGEILAEKFEQSGGRELALVPCLNAEGEWVSALADLIRASLAQP